MPDAFSKIFNILVNITKFSKIKKDTNFKCSPFMCVVTAINGSKNKATKKPNQFVVVVFNQRSRSGPISSFNSLTVYCKCMRVTRLGKGRPPCGRARLQSKGNVLNI